MIAFDKGRVYSGSSRDYALLRWLIMQIILYRLGKKVYLAILKQNRKGQVLFIIQTTIYLSGLLSLWLISRQPLYLNNVISYFKVKKHMQQEIS
jgi:hypothetical protein